MLLLALGLLGQNRQEQIRVIHSDRLFLTKVGEEQVMELSGKVHFWYGETEFKSNRALIFDRQKIARLDGQVRVSNDSLSLEADSLAYYRIPETLNAGGKVRITEQKKSGAFSWFQSDFAIYNKLENNVTAWSSVRSFDSSEQANASCGYAFWDRRNGYAYMVENPQLNTAGQDTLQITADKIEYFEEERKVAATFNVTALAQDYQASSDFLLYFLNEDKAVFTGQPRFESDLATASAREFYLFFAERKLTHAELVDSCRVQFSEERGKLKSNWVHASFIELDFSEGEIRGFHAERGVDYAYTQEQTEERDFLANQASGEVLDASFGEDNKIQIMVMQQGIKGTYRFRNKS